MTAARLFLSVVVMSWWWPTPPAWGQGEAPAPPAVDEPAPEETPKPDPPATGEQPATDEQPGTSTTGEPDKNDSTDANRPATDVPTDTAEPDKSGESPEPPGASPPERNPPSSDPGAKPPAPPGPAEHPTIGVSKKAKPAEDRPPDDSGKGKNTDDTPADAIDLGKGEVIVITGSRVEQPLATTTVATEVITRKEIESSGASTVSGLLEEHPGVEIVNGLQGTSVRMQGLDPSYTLILVDGQRVIGRVDGAVDLERYGVENIERIEIVKGASSALYGSDAIGGVVNIITRRSKKPLEGQVSLKFGQNGVLDTDATAGVRQGPVNSRFSAGYRHSDAIDLDPSDPHTNASAAEQWQVANSTVFSRGPVELRAALDYMRRDMKGINSLVIEGTNATAVLDRRNLVEMASGGLQGKWKLSRTKQLSANARYSIYRDQFAYDQHDSNDLDQYEETIENLFEASAQFDGALTDRHLIIAGLEGMREFLEAPRLRERLGNTACDIEVDPDCDRTGDRYRFAVFAQDEVLLSKSPSLILVPGIRLDRDSQFGNHVSPKLALRWDASDKIIVRASYGQGYRAPDFKQLYLCFENPNAGYFIVGNPDLEAETSHSFNLGTELRPHKRAWMSVNLFYNSLTNLINFDLAEDGVGDLPACGMGMLQPYSLNNIDSALTRGVETLVRVKPSLGRAGSLMIEAGYVFTDAVEVQDELVATRPLPGRPAHRGSFKLGYELAKIGFEAHIRGALVGGRIFYEGDEQTTVDGHATVDARIAQTIRKRFVLFAGVDNILDEGEPDVLIIRPRTYYIGTSAKY